MASNEKQQPPTASTPDTQPRPGDSSGSNDSENDNGNDNSDAASIGGQRTTMAPRALTISVLTLSVCLLVSFIDQTSVSTVTPMIAEELDTGTLTSWIGASFLVASTAFQMINGRLSDIFGRKNLLLVCLALIAVGDLACGFSRTAAQLFAFRSIAGVGGGGVNSLVMIIVSDITTLEKRGKYQGILGAVIAVANGIGPFLGGAIADNATWRWVFWIIPIITVPTMGVIRFQLPLVHTPGDYMAKVRQIDYGGIALNLASTVLVLVPLSGGGVTYAWSSPFFISALTVGLVLGVAFTLYEYKVARLPIMPLRLFRAPHAWALYLQTFLIGLAYYGNFFYLPIYFQSILRYSALVSGALILPVILTTSVGSIASGQYLDRVGNYREPICAGFALWTVGCGLTLLFRQDSPVWLIVVASIVEGMGIGFTLQPTLVGLYANGRKEDRAVTTGLRNFIRTIGGAFGLVVSGLILSNALLKGLSGHPGMTHATIQHLSSSTYDLQEMGFSSEQVALIRRVYMHGLRSIFIFYTCCSAAAFLLTAAVGNTGLKAQTKGGAEASQKDGDTAGDSGDTDNGDKETGVQSARDLESGNLHSRDGAH